MAQVPQSNNVAKTAEVSTEAVIEGENRRLPGRQRSVQRSLIRHHVIEVAAV